MPVGNRARLGLPPEPLGPPVSRPNDQCPGANLGGLVRLVISGAWRGRVRPNGQAGSTGPALSAPCTVRLSIFPRGGRVPRTGGALRPMPRQGGKLPGIGRRDDVDMAFASGTAHGHIGQLASSAVFERVGDVHSGTLRTVGGDGVGVGEFVAADVLGPMAAGTFRGESDETGPGRRR